LFFLENLSKMVFFRVQTRYNRVPNRLPSLGEGAGDGICERIINTIATLNYSPNRQARGKPTKYISEIIFFFRGKPRGIKPSGEIK